MRSTISLREMPADETVQPTGMLGVAAAAIYFWKSLLASIAAGYQAGFVWVAAVGVYLLLRRDIDQAEMDEVYIDEEQDYGIPPLASDMASGVPEVSPDDDAQPGDTGGSPPEE